MNISKVESIGFILITFGLLAFAAWVRLWKLNLSPPSVNFDEAALGYNAYSILTTGRDEYGTYLPLALRSFNDYKPALYAYLSLIPIKLMGLSEIATRLVSAIAGIVEVVFIFLLVGEFVRGRGRLAIAFSVVVVQPWLIHFSRTAFEANLGAMFFAIGGWLLIKNRPWAATIPLALAAFSYHSPRLAAPVFIFLVALDQLWRRPEVKKAVRAFLPLVLLVVLMAPIFLTFSNSLVLKRYQQTNIFKMFYPFTPKELISANNPWLTFPANPLYYLAGMVVGHAASYFSPIDLGGRVYHWVRNSPMYIPDQGVLGWLESATFVFGMVVAARNIRQKKYRLLIYWIAASISPAIVTWEWFHPLRSLDAFPAILTIAILGLLALGERLPRKLAVAAYLCLFFPTAIFVTENELIYQVYANHGEYQPGGFKEGVPILATLQDKYDKVIIDTPHAQAYIFFLFYQHFSPTVIQQYAPIRPSPQTEGDLTFNFANYEFRKIDWPKDKNLHHVIFWASPNLNLDDVRREPGTRIIEIKNAVGTDAAFIITKD